VSAGERSTVICTGWCENMHTVWSLSGCCGSGRARRWAHVIHSLSPCSISLVHFPNTPPPRDSKGINFQRMTVKQTTWLIRTSVVNKSLPLTNRLLFQSSRFPLKSTRPTRKTIRVLSWYESVSQCSDTFTLIAPKNNCCGHFIRHHPLFGQSSLTIGLIHGTVFAHSPSKTPPL
jgi:hypothetical protein